MSQDHFQTFTNLHTTPTCNKNNHNTCQFIFKYNLCIQQNIQPCKGKNTQTITWCRAKSTQNAFTHINNKYHKKKFHPHIYDHQTPPPKKVPPSSTKLTTNTNAITSKLNLTPSPQNLHQTFLCNCQHNKLKTLNLNF